MKLSEIIKEVNKDIDDSLPNADITGWINRALDDLSPVAKYQKSKAIDLVPGQGTYSLPTDIVEMVYIDGLNQPLLSSRETKDGYKLWGNTLILQPPPTETKRITLFYFGKLPYLINSDDVPMIPAHFHDLLVLYAVAKAKYQDEEESMQMNVMAEYMAKKRVFEQEMNKTSNVVSQVRLV